MIITGTGHRPPKLGGYDKATFIRLVDLATAALQKFQPETVISGMALGWDQALAQAATDLGIRWMAAIPFENQAAPWPAEAQVYYDSLLRKAYSCYLVTAGPYSARKMQVRNEFMVDHADHILALWNGEPAGGTYNTVQYARQIGKPITNLWASWTKYK